MDLLPRPLETAAATALLHLRDGAWDAAAGGAKPAGRAAVQALANAAQGAIFSDALLAALHERLSQLKAVTK